MAGIKGGADDGLLADADILIEAVFEDLAAKRAVKKLSAVCRADAKLATISPTSIRTRSVKGSAIPNAFWACISSVRRIL